MRAHGEGGHTHTRTYTYTHEVTQSRLMVRSPTRHRRLSCATGPVRKGGASQIDTTTYQPFGGVLVHWGLLARHHPLLDGFPQIGLQAAIAREHLREHTHTQHTPQPTNGSHQRRNGGGTSGDFRSRGAHGTLVSLVQIWLARGSPLISFRSWSSVSNSGPSATLRLVANDSVVSGAAAAATAALRAALDRRRCLFISVLRRGGGDGGTPSLPCRNTQWSTRERLRALQNGDAA